MCCRMLKTKQSQVYVEILLYADVVRESLDADFLRTWTGIHAQFSVESYLWNFVERLHRV